MSPDDSLAQRRWLALVGVRLAGVAGAVLGLVLIARSYEFGPKLLGAAIVLSAMGMIATVPRSLARKWRTPPPGAGS